MHYFEAGSLHILHNVSKDNIKALDKYESFFHPLFLAVCGWFSRERYRDLIAAALFSGGVALQFRRQVRNFHPKKVYERWGMMIQALDNLLDIEHAFVNFWDEKKLKAGKSRFHRDDGGEGDDEEEEGAELSKCSQFIGDLVCWAHAKMLCIAFAIVGHIENDFESCPCHRKFYKLKARTRKKVAWRRRGTQDAWRSNRGSCKLAVCIVGELAAGELWDVLATYRHLALLEVMKVCAGLSCKDRDMILTEFERSFQHLTYILKLKFCFWKSNPYMLLALAHHNVIVAREVCKQAFVQACSFVSDEQRRLQHRFTKALCFPGSTLHAEFRKFVVGCDLQELPQLSRFRARLKLIRVIERPVENKHQLLQRNAELSTNASGAFISYGMRDLQMDRFIRETPDGFKQLAYNVSNCRTGLHILSELSLLKHLAVTGVLQNASAAVGGSTLQDTFGMGAKNWGVVDSAVYHTDDSIYKPVCSTVEDDAPPPVPPQEPKVNSQKDPSGLTRALQSLAVQHFRSRARKDCFYERTRVGQEGSPESLYPMSGALHEFVTSGTEFHQ